MAPVSKRTRILSAAATVVEESGAAHLTIDAVAAEAGVSKGGVLYHFPSKQALLEGMLQSLIEQMRSGALSYQQAHPQELNGPLVGRIVEQFEQSPSQRAMSRAVLAAAAQDPELVAPARAVVSTAMEEAGAHSRPTQMGWVLQLASEGIRFLEMLQLSPFSPTQRRKLHRYLLELAREHGV